MSGTKRMKQVPMCLRAVFIRGRGRNDILQSELGPGAIVDAGCAYFRINLLSIELGSE